MLSPWEALGQGTLGERGAQETQALISDAAERREAIIGERASSRQAASEDQEWVSLLDQIYCDCRGS